VFETDAEAGAVGQILVRVEEAAQQRAQRVAAQGLRAQRLLHLQVQPRHVDAALVRSLEIDEGTDAGT